MLELLGMAIYCSHGIGQRYYRYRMTLGARSHGVFLEASRLILCRETVINHLSPFVPTTPPPYHFVKKSEVRGPLKGHLLSHAPSLKNFDRFSTIFPDRGKHQPTPETREDARDQETTSRRPRNNTEQREMDNSPTRNPEPSTKTPSLTQPRIPGPIP